MHLTAFTDFGLRILMLLAGAPGRSFTTKEIASEFEISRNHLAKVVQDLAKGGYIKTQRGSGGGILLAMAPQSITLGDVVRFMERRHAMVECFRADGGKCKLTPQCLLKQRFFEAKQAFLRELDTTTLAECAYSGTVRGINILLS